MSHLGYNQMIFIWFKERRMPLIDHFGILAPLYDRVFKQVDVEHWRNLLNLPGQGLLLDIGGGTGRVSTGLSQYVRKIIVLDESLEMLAEAVKKPGLSGVMARAENLPIENNSIDFIIMVDAFHHLHNQLKTLEEVVRILIPGGKIIIEEPDIELFGVKLLALGEKIILMRSHFMASNKITAFLTKHGLKVEIRKAPPNFWVIGEKPE
jgi:ubiquinone/menaquinone biosynthesis C-methylase UbiE